ncbi:MAG TPA: hypothetical protein VJN18_35825 [Polyangiaceae bacterium]|nr:hypothetical protein [Polyangiaceae bacterium]
MSDQAQSAATETTTPATGSGGGVDMAAFSALMSLPTDAPKPATETKEATKDAKAAPAAANPADDDAADPLDESLYTEEALSSPEKLKEARARLFKHLGKVNELTRKAHRAHGAAETREKKLAKREETVTGREHRVELVERSQAKAIEDLTSGDTQRFLTGFAAMTKAGDPAGFWKEVSLSLLKGEPVPKKQQAQAAADPDLQRRVDQLEQGFEVRREREETAEIERLKTQHYETAKSSGDKYPHVAAWAAANPQDAREGIAAVMLEECRRIGRPVDISTACGIIESALSSRYELSQRADGQTNGEKGTTGSGPDAGRETSKEPPKPETAVTVPAALASAPGSAMRSETEEERRARQIRELDQLGFF